MYALLAGPGLGEHVSDIRLLAIAVSALGFCLLWIWLAAYRHRRCRDSIPIRIHVAGTRGKSSTTRLIAAGLRAGGRRVLAKTTGSEPRLILPDGSETTWSRRGPAAVREQVKFFAQAARLRVDAVVVECMAVHPEFVWASERHLVRATTAIITNARPDHFEDLGSDPDATSEALHWVVPDTGQLVVGNEAMSPRLQAWAETRGTTISVVETAGLSPERANKVLALAVCAAHSVAPAVAVAAIDADPGDPATFFERRLVIDGKTVGFANAFACNDAESLARLWSGRNDGNQIVVLLNARADRPLRSRHFLKFLAAQTPMPILYVVGDPLARRLARRAGFGRETLRQLRARNPEHVLSELAAAASLGSTIWGIGNYQGFGARLIEALNRHGASC